MEETDKQLVDRPLYVDRIMEFADTDLIKVLTGLRRSGKSDLLELVRRRLIAQGRSREQFISLNFEDYALSPLRDASKLYAHLEERIAKISGKPYIFLDEIQEVPGFEKLVNSLRVAHQADVYITGSNSSLLSGELATYLAGRYVQFTVYPFGFAEFRAARQSLGADDSFKAFLQMGGMPFAASGNLSEESQRTYLTDIYHSVVLKDIVQRYRIRDIALLERIVRFALSNVGNVISANSVASYLKSERIELSSQTVLNYLSYCQQSFLLERLDRVDIIGKKQLKTLQKYYVADLGLRQAILGDGQTQIQGLLENVVALEGLRRGYQVNVGTAGSQEVDFIFRKGERKHYIQVAYLLDSPETAAREFGAFAPIRDSYPKTVLTLDPILQPRNGISHRHLEEFLLDKDW
ncbi:ATPase [Bombiscardovia nodaiensis]|uniref:ATPase n=1 Tax=Bombiscardovia nodaiensis TaxID=2932181 RepID=A0ABM8B646_9BIFI|nr:ATPase [Bombiscardovia nodaiensis]